MARVIAGLLVAASLTGAMPANARGPHGGGGMVGHARHGHPINAWLGSRRLRLR
jgi:hypothetical protein